MSVRDGSTFERFQKRKGMGPMTRFANFVFICQVFDYNNNNMVREQTPIQSKIVFHEQLSSSFKQKLCKTEFAYYLKGSLGLKANPPLRSCKFEPHLV